MYNHTYGELISNLPVSQADIDFFAKLPFVYPYMGISSRYQSVPFVTRYNKGDLSDKFFNKTINSYDTVPRVLAFMRKSTPRQDPVTGNEGKDNDALQDPEEAHFVVFCQLESGVNGYIDTAHGGLLAALLDETLGLCAESYRVFASDERQPLLTAKLEVTYRAPVPTPNVVVIKSWVRRKDGRKWFLEAQILDQNGSVKAEAKSLYIRTRSAL